MKLSVSAVAPWLCSEHDQSSGASTTILAAIIAASDEYAEAATGNRDFFLNNHIAWLAVRNVVSFRNRNCAADVRSRRELTSSGLAEMTADDPLPTCEAILPK